MFSLLIWIVFGFVVGVIAKAIHPGPDPVGFIATTFIGILGSIIGGSINWILSTGTTPYSPSGLIMSIVGGVLYCIGYRYYLLKTSPEGPRNFFTGKLKNKDA